MQGERQMAKDNVTLGRFQLDGIPPARRGVPQIEVTFDIDANGIVNVKAKDMGTGKEQHITITASTNLSEEEIEAKIKEAEENAEADKLIKEKIETHNQLDTMIYECEKQLEELGDKATDEEKTNVEEKIKEAKDALEKDELEIMKTALEALQEAFQPIAQKMYAEAQAEQPGAEGAAGAGAADDVVDADYEVVD